MDCEDSSIDLFDQIVLYAHVGNMIHHVDMFSLFPVDAGYRAHINGLKLDFLFSRPVRVKAFRLAGTRKVEYIGKVIDAYSASDAHLVINNGLFPHIGSPFIDGYAMQLTVIKNSVV